jgi:hypothetical protein
MLHDSKTNKKRSLIWSEGIFDLSLESEYRKKSRIRINNNSITSRLTSRETFIRCK